MSNITIPFIPENAPFTSAQRAWLNGFLAGMYASAPVAVGGNAAAAPAVAEKITANIYFGSESGNCEALAKQIAKAAVKRGFESKPIGLDKVKPADLANERFALIVTSTFGDGDPPENAKDFHADLHSDSQPRLENLSYSVLALGDTNYEHFCKCGIDIDQRLAALGAKRIYERVDCDVDYEAPASVWQDGIFGVLEAMATSPDQPPPATNGAVQSAPTGIPSAVETVEEGPAYSKKNPFPATLLVNRRLTADESAKETRHYEISLAGSGLTYEVGDALGVVPTNCPALVEDLLHALNRDGEEAVRTADDDEVPLRTALLRHYEITKIPAQLLKVIAERSADKTLADVMVPEAKEALNHYLWGREIIDLLLDFPSVTFTPAEFVSHLRKLQPRLYSISSSIHAFPEQVHLTIAAVRYESFNRKRKGVCSTFLADRVNGSVPVFVQVSKGFRLPASGDTPIIMVGPGTGIAPFRAFLHDRRVSGAKGRNWLFFGDQKASTDFLYKEELEAMLADGHLTRLDTAFSRDQAQKVYVQHRMVENAAELYNWLEDGAHFYVCGDASRMAKDVDAALHMVIETVSGRSGEAAAEYVSQLKASKRYQRDVY
jgi:sulfite reductase (NADPH) flavoprotein alpha-component